MPSVLFALAACIMALALGFLLGCEDGGLGRDESIDQVNRIVDQLEQVQAEINQEGADLEAAIRGETSGGSGSDPAPGDPPAETGGSQQFLWKPVSDVTGNLVVLIPARYTGNTDRDSAGIYADQCGGRLIERAPFRTVANNNREHYNGSLPGAGYPRGCWFCVRSKNGQTWAWRIPNPSQRDEQQ